MVHWAWLILSLIVGGCIGVIAMACFAVSGRCSRREESRENMTQ
jgi:purine-cytosine permease-like protein